MADTAQIVVDRTRGLLLGGASEQLNTLSANYTAGSGTLSFTYAIDPIGPGARLSIGQVVFQVISADRVAKTAVVLAGQEGSVDTNLSSGAVVRANPRFSDYVLFTTLNHDLADLSGRGIFQMLSYEFVWQSTRNAYDLPITMLEPYALRYQTPDTHKDWVYLNRPVWRIERNANTTDFPSGMALHLHAPLHTGYKAILLYKAALTPLAAVSSLVSASGLPDSAADLPELGIAARLLPHREAKRNFVEAQMNPRREQEVPSGGMLRAAAGVGALRERRIAVELGRLRKLYPDRTS